MELTKKKRKHHRFYIPWYTRDEDLYEEEDQEEDSWVHYLRRNFSHPAGMESPFPDSSWSYATGHSVFDKEQDQDNYGRELDDASIHDAVTEALYLTRELDASHIRVLVLNGIVCLFGTVTTSYEISAAEKLTREIPGVWSVRNELVLEEEKPSLQ